MIGVTVLRNRYVRSWPDKPDKPVGERAYVLPLGKALSRSYRTDAHFTQYMTPNDRRLSKDALDELDAVSLGIVAFDVDCPDTHGSSEPAPEEWREAEREKIGTLFTVHPGGFAYETKGGYRIVYAQPEPTVLRTQGEALRWRQYYAVAVAHLAHRFRIEADPACCDWTRLFRLPHATRDGGDNPEAWPVHGNPHAIGTLRIAADGEDLKVAASTSKAFRTPRTQDLAPLTNDGHGLLFHALRRRGDVLRQDGVAYVIRCPNERQHTSGRTGDRSTLLYLPAAGEQIGAVHCLHAHCQDLSVREWLRLFSDVELDEARRAAGIASRRSAA